MIFADIFIALIFGVLLAVIVNSTTKQNWRKIMKVSEALEQFKAEVVPKLDAIEAEIYELKTGSGELKPKDELILNEIHARIGAIASLAESGRPEEEAEEVAEP